MCASSEPKSDGKCRLNFFFGWEVMVTQYFRRMGTLGEWVSCICKRTRVHRKPCYCYNAASWCPRRTHVSSCRIPDSVEVQQAGVHHSPDLERPLTRPHPPLRLPASGLVPTAEPQWGVLLLGNNMAVSIPFQFDSFR